MSAILLSFIAKRCVRAYESDCCFFFKLFFIKFPIFVSDATRENVDDMISFLKLSYLKERLLVQEHEYWNSRFEWFDEMPNKLRLDLGKSDLCIVKGDANYRKLVGDRRWIFFPQKSF